MKMICINQSILRINSSLLSLLFIPLLTTNVYASTAAPVMTCAPGTFAGISIPPTDPDFAVVTTGFTVTGATLTNSPTLGEYCEILGNIKTIETSQVPLNPGDNESTIQIAIRLPTVWNTKYMQYGGGGLDGSLAGQAVPGFAWGSTAVNSPQSATYSPDGGYAIAATDSGHVGGANGFINVDGTQNVARWVNFGYKSRHLLTVVAKSAIQNYYGQLPSLAFHSGTSTGGRSVLVAAARYPNDFDAVLAGYPAHTTNGLIAARTFITQAQFPANCTASTLSVCLASQVIPTAGVNNLLPLIDTVTMNKCDPADGLVDGIISNPGACEFNPMNDFPTCTGAPGPNCLTLAQKNALTVMYSDTVVPPLGVVYRRFLPGYQNTTISGLGLDAFWFGTGTPPLARPSQYAAGEDNARFLIYNNPLYTIQSINLSTNASDLINWQNCPGPCSKFDPNAAWDPVSDADLMAFKTTGGTQGTGGKLLIFQGLADLNVAPQNTIKHYEDVIANVGGLNNTRDFARLYLIPGRGHSSSPAGAPPNAPANVGVSLGANTGFLTALEKWVDTGIAPEFLLGENTVPTPISRPLCAYPFKAVYTGPAGDALKIRNASYFQCRFYDFHGFFNPVDNAPTLNKVKAGQAIPVKFSLKGDWGLNIMASGYPKSEAISCNASNSVNGVDEIVSANTSGLQYDATNDQYSYVWKTDKNWKDSCRQLVIRLNEGTTVRANFSFK